MQDLVVVLGSYNIDSQPEHLTELRKEYSNYDNDFLMLTINSTVHTRIGQILLTELNSNYDILTLLCRYISTKHKELISYEALYTALSLASMRYDLNKLTYVYKKDIVHPLVHHLLNTFFKNLSVVEQL